MASVAIFDSQRLVDSFVVFEFIFVCFVFIICSCCSLAFHSGENVDTYYSGAHTHTHTHLTADTIGLGRICTQEMVIRCGRIVDGAESRKC